MNIWLAVSLVLAVVTIYLFVIEVFSVAFKLTGMATSKIRFQVASLFTGTGYTTAESELIAKDEKRIADWKKICKNLYVYCYPIVWANLFAALPNYDEMYYDIHYFAEQGIKGVYAEGYPGGARFSDPEFGELKAYLMKNFQMIRDTSILGTILKTSGARTKLNNLLKKKS